MWISDETIDSALLRIYRDDKVFEAGKGLMLAELKSRWLETGFREADLTAALRRLELEGCLERSMDGCVTLLQPGEQRLGSLSFALGDFRRRVGKTLFPRHGHPGEESHATRRRADREHRRNV